MRDSRITTLAKQVAEYSLYLKPGEKVWIEAWDGCNDFVTEFVNAIYKIGAFPYVTLMNRSVNRAFMMGLTEESAKVWCDFELARMSQMDAYIGIRNEENAYEYADVPAEKLRLYNKYNGILHEKQRNFQMKWCILRYPSASMAQLSATSTEAFEDFYFSTNCIDYKRLNEIAVVLNQLCCKTDRVRIIAPGTDLTFSIKGLSSPYSCCGIFNRPCGETGMGVVQGTANGTIRYNIPSQFQGTIFSNVEFTFRNGVIVKATSDHEELMNRILDTDEGARRIGEFAIGFNPLITKPMLDTLFDEKMAMTLHFTPGNGFNNPSGIHWDLVQSHAPEYGGGEIWFDDVLIRKDGLFVLEELLPLNPENLIKQIVVEA